MIRRLFQSAYDNQLDNHLQDMWLFLRVRDRRLVYQTLMNDEASHRYFERITPDKQLSWTRAFKADEESRALAQEEFPEDNTNIHDVINILGLKSGERKGLRNLLILTIHQLKDAGHILGGLGANWEYYRGLASQHMAGGRRRHVTRRKRTSIARRRSKMTRRR